MGGTVYLKTDRFEVKLEGFTFKVRDFEPLCTLEFLFPKGKVWRHQPIVGIDVMRHPRDPSIGLLLLCFGIGCVILRFHLGEQLPDPITKFLQDKRIYFVGFGIPEKKDLFPFNDLGLKESEVDVGYLAANLLNDPKLKKCELADLARRVLGIKNMVGLTEARSLGRHKQIKCAICEVFVSTVIAMTLLDQKKEDKLVNSPKKGFFAKNLDSTKGWSKLLTSNNKEYISGDDSSRGAVSPANNKQPLKGILKCQSSSSLPQMCASPPKSPQEEQRGFNLKRANSKGHNVSFVTKNNNILLI